MLRLWRGSCEKLQAQTPYHSSMCHCILLLLLGEATPIIQRAAVPSKFFRYFFFFCTANVTENLYVKWVTRRYSMAHRFLSAVIRKALMWESFSTVLLLLGFLLVRNLFKVACGFIAAMSGLILTHVKWSSSNINWPHHCPWLNVMAWRGSCALCNAGNRRCQTLQRSNIMDLLHVC